MDNFDKYTYARTLRFLEAYYPYDYEDVHFANVMLSMNQCNTIDELIVIRERLKGKVDKIYYSASGKLPKDLIDEISKTTSTSFYTLHSRIQYNLKADINSCYDENVFRLFKDSKIITANSCGECFINLSHCNKKSPYIELIVSEAKERSNIEVSELLFAIAKRYNVFGEHWKKFKEFEKGMNGYNSAKKVVEDDFEYLKQFNWRLLPEQMSLYNVIDREKQKKREEHAKYLKEQREKKEREEVKRKVEELRNERTNNIIKIVLGVIVFVVILVLICVYVPSEVMNWFWAILVWLAIMKTILNKL